MRWEFMLPYIDKDKLSIEIGPLDKPFLKKGEYNVKYADIRNRECLEKDYIGDKAGYGTVCEIDYVISQSESSLSDVVGENAVKTVFSSHMIEHCSDFISHFVAVGKVLEEGGIYAFILPDKRYTFDRFRECTPFRDAFDVYKNGGLSSRRLAFDSAINYATGEYGSILLPDRDQAMKWYDEYENRQGFQHIWVFTHTSCLRLLCHCIWFGLIPFELAETQSKGDSFGIVLRKNSAVLMEQDVRSTVCSYIIDRVCGEEGIVPLKDRTGEEIFIYGAGHVGKGVYHYAKCAGIRVLGFLVTDGHHGEDLYGIPVYGYSEVKDLKDHFVCVAFYGNTEVCKKLDAAGVRYLRIVE